MNQAYAGDLSPKQAWELLCSDAQAVLVDVRTPAEWAYVGIPDLSGIGKKPVLVPWIDFPAMQPNERFLDEAGKGARTGRSGRPALPLRRALARRRRGAHRRRVRPVL